MDETFLRRAEEDPDRIPTMIAELNLNLNVPHETTGRTPLGDAIQWLQSIDTASIAVEAINELVRLGSNPNIPSSINGTTALHQLMVTTGENTTEAFLQVLDRLLESGGDPNLPTTTDGKTPFHTLMNQTMYSYNGDAILGALDRLLAHGANPNLLAQDNRSVLRTFMDHTIYSYNVETYLGVLDRLLRSGANPNLFADDNKASLHTLMSKSIYSYNQETILSALNKLLEYQADPTLVSSTNDSTVLQYTMNQTIYSYNGQAIVTVLDRLLESGATGQSFVPTLVGRTISPENREATISALSCLLRHGTSPNYQDPEGKTALHILAKTTEMTSDTKLEILTLLLQNGADTATIEDNDGNLPMNYLGNSDAFNPSVAFLLIQQMFRSGL